MIKKVSILTIALILGFSSVALVYELLGYFSRRVSGTVSGISRFANSLPPIVLS